MKNRVIELLTASLERRKLGTVKDDSIRLSFAPAMPLPVSAALPDLEGVEETDLEAAVERVVDTLDALDSTRPFAFSHSSTHAGLEDAFDRHFFPIQFDVAPGLRLQLKLGGDWWQRETGSVPQSAEEAVNLSVRWMLDRTTLAMRNNVHEFSGPHALCALFAVGLKVAGEPVFVFVDNRTVWLAGDGDVEDLAQAVVMALEAVGAKAEAQTPPIFGEIYRRFGPGDLRRWVPPVGHQLRDECIALRRVALRLTYRLQSLLFASRDVPLPLATIEGQAGAPLVATCSEFPCLVPAVEEVRFESGSVPFSGLLASSLLKRMPLRTPWFELSRQPTREETLALGHIPRSWSEEA